MTRLFVVEQRCKGPNRRAEWYPLLNCISTSVATARVMMERIPMQRHAIAFGVRWRIREYKRAAQKPHD